MKNKEQIFEIRIGTGQLSPDLASKIEIRLTEFLSIERPFLKAGYTLRELSIDLQFPLHHLSAFINQYYGVHFNYFLNEYRVNHFKEKIINEEWKRKKIEAIAEESGFKNRNTFTLAFKKVTGLNPSKFIKDVQKKNFNVHQI